VPWESECYNGPERLSKGGAKMVRQMSLFPSKEAQENQEPIQALEGGALDEMFAACHRFRSSSEYLELLNFIVRFPKYSAFNCLLLYFQNPSITFVATSKIWQRQFSRRLKYIARPLVILAPMSPVRFLYDLADTEGDAIPPSLLISLEDKYRLSRDIFDNTIHNCGVNGIIVREMQFSHQTKGAPIPITHEALQKYGGLDLDSQMNYLILLNQAHSLEDKYARLVYELGQIFCGHFGIHSNAWWKNRRDETSSVREIETESVALLVCRRKRLFENSKKFFSHLSEQDREIPMLGLHAVFNATSYIEDMGKKRWKKPKKQSRHTDA